MTMTWAEKASSEAESECARLRRRIRNYRREIRGLRDAYRTEQWRPPRYRVKDGCHYSESR